MSDSTLEERVAKLEEKTHTLEWKLIDLDNKVNAIFKKIDEMKEDMHDYEVRMLKKIGEIKIFTKKLSSDIKWYGRIPTLAFSSLSFISTLLILLKMLGLLNSGVGK